MIYTFFLGQLRIKLPGSVRVFFNRERSSSWQQIGGRWAWSTLGYKHWWHSVWENGRRVCVLKARWGVLIFWEEGSCGGGELWEANVEEGRRPWCWGQIGLINFLVKVAAFSEQQPRQKQQIVAFAYLAFGTQFVWAL
jgi:hypothetical protein